MNGMISFLKMTTMIQKMAMTVVIASTVLCSCVGNQSERSGARDTSEIALTDMDVEGGEMFLLAPTRRKVEVKAFISIVLAPIQASAIR